MDFSKLIRTSVQAIAPYSSARDEFSGPVRVALDANESPFQDEEQADINRYPDPYQMELKGAISKVSGVPVAEIFLGNGSDEALDVLLKTVADPGVDEVVVPNPSFGMYKVLAIEQGLIIKVAHLNENLDLKPAAIKPLLSPHTKVVFICSPNNPTGKSVPLKSLVEIAESTKGLVVVDEAYIDFSSQPSALTLRNTHKNIVVVQTMSKAWGLAGARVGMLFGPEELVKAMNKVKHPYNINCLSQRVALKRLSEVEKVAAQVEIIKSERARVAAALAALPIVREVVPSDANFHLVRFVDGNAVFDYLCSKGVITRNRGRERGCENCLRITVGTPDENNILLGMLRALSAEVG